MAKKSFGTKEVSPGVIYIDSIQAVASLKTTSKKTASQEKVVLPDIGEEKLFGVSDDVVIWGTNNLFPNEWEEAIEQNDTISDAIEKEIDRIVAGGMEFGYEEIDENGERTFKYFDDPEIETFLNHIRQKFAFEQTVRDYIVHRLPVAELLFDAAKSKCIGISAIPATHFRWGHQDKNGFINFGYLNRNWKLGRKSTSDDTTKIPVIDPLVDTVEILKLEINIFKYVFRVPLPTHRTYYALAPAYTAMTSRWLPIANKTAAYYDFSLDNQMSPKYHIEVDEEYMAKKYGDRWLEATAVELNKMMFEELDHFNSMMHGVSNSGRNLMTLKRIHPVLQKEYSSWVITEFKGSVFEKGYIDLLRESVLHIVKAVGLDPTIQGGNTSSGMGGGSGSDKREAFNIRMATAMRHVDKILAPFNFALEYNGKKAPNGAAVKLRMVTPFLQTQNNITPTERQNTLPTQTDKKP